MLRRSRNPDSSGLKRSENPNLSGLKHNQNPDSSGIPTGAKSAQLERIPVLSESGKAQFDVKSESSSRPLGGVDSTRLPVHIAVIMDGNGRWAKKRRLPRIEGHRAGIKAVREVAEGSRELGIKFLTLYAFSVENWKRPKLEVDALMKLLHKFLLEEIKEMKETGIRFNVWGRIEELPENIQKAITEAKESTKTCTEMVLTLALNYGGRIEIVDAARKIALKVAKGELNPEKIDKDLFESHLYSAGVPDPDLLIRTSGELRISNFLLWQVAYTELVISPVLWPDFRREHLWNAIREYQSRNRRFGGINLLVGGAEG